MATGSPCACCCAPADRPITSTPPVVDALLLLHACQCKGRHTVSDVPPRKKRASEDGCGLRAAIAAQPITHFVLRKQVYARLTPADGTVAARTLYTVKNTSDAINVQTSCTENVALRQTR